jgi:hypothetical protein
MLPYPLWQECLGFRKKKIIKIISPCDLGNRRAIAYWIA